MQAQVQGQSVALRSIKSSGLIAVFHFLTFVMFPAEIPTLDYLTFKAIKPGLSAYADDPEEVQLPLLLTSIN